MPKKKSIPEPEELTFDVECINEARVTKNKQWEYNIKWGGYSEEENSWEPESNLTGCRRMMQEFWNQVGSENKARAKHFSPGHRVFPSKLWIKSQRLSYRKTAEKKKKHKNRIEETDDTDETDEETRDSTSKVTGHGTTPAQAADTLEFSDEDDVPLSMKVAPRIHAEFTRDDSAASQSKDENASSKRMRDEESDTDHSKPSSGLNKRPKVSVQLSMKTPAVISTSRKGKEKETSRSTSPDSPLFGPDSDSDTPLASKSSPSALAGSSSRQAQSQSSTSTSRPSHSLDTTRPKEKSLPAHLHRKLNPRVKAMPMSGTDSGSIGGISTKARIYSQGSVLGPRSTAIGGSKNLPSTSRTPTGSSIVRDPPEESSSSTSTPGLEVDNWLKANIRSKDELVGNTTERAGPLSTEPSTSNTQQGLHFSKRWRWTGELAVGDNESDERFAESVGGIVLTDSTTIDPKAGQIGIHLLVPNHVHSLCLRHQYPLAALPTALGDFKVSQFARMTGDQTSDECHFDDLVSHMTKHELFSQTPLSIAEQEAATMFLFPASLEHLWDIVGVPPRARQGGGLLVAIGFQSYVPPKLALGGFMEIYRPAWTTHSRLDAAFETHTLDCSRALITLNFPEPLFKRVTQKECAIFTTPGDKDLPGSDTLALRTVLRNAPGCKIVPVLSGNARFIFIHVSAWGVLHKLPGLVDRRLRRLDVQFYTYGSDSFVERKRWGVREVFPIGGIVTFTPRAIAEDPEGVERLIAKLDEHPLWACYILPSVVAMVLEVANSDDTPNSQLKNAVDALCGILMPIEKGQIALTWQPPSRTSWCRDLDTDKELQPTWVDWMIDQAHLSELKGHELVLECRKRFNQCQDRTEKDVETRMVKDLLAMQSELREEYRRFVIITDTSGTCNTSREVAATTSLSKADIKDGFEFTHVKDFSFGDDYPFPDDKIIP